MVTLGTVLLVILAAASLVLFETMKSIPEEGKRGQPKYIAIEVVVVGALILGAVMAWRWLTK